jgi:hypothetical protein
MGSRLRGNDVVVRLLLNFQSAGQYTVDTGAARADQFRKGGTQ